MGYLGLMHWIREHVRSQKVINCISGVIFTTNRTDINASTAWNVVQSSFLKLAVAAVWRWVAYTVCRHIWVLQIPMYDILCIVIK